MVANQIKACRPQLKQLLAPQSQLSTLKGKGKAYLSWVVLGPGNLPEAPIEGEVVSNGVLGSESKT